MLLVIYFPYFCSQKGQTPLHYAAQNDHSQLVTLFLNHKPGVMMQQNAVGNSYMCHRWPRKVACSASYGLLLSGLMMACHHYRPKKWLVKWLIAWRTFVKQNPRHATSWHHSLRSDSNLLCKISFHVSSACCSWGVSLDVKRTIHFFWHCTLYCIKRG